MTPWRKHYKIMKELQAFHVVLTTHNSRFSRRMIKYGVRRGPAVKLELKEEILLTRIIGTIVRENGYKVLAFNICRDHLHLMPVCQYDELTRIVQKIKSVSSKLFHRQVDMKPGGRDPLENRAIKHLWSQKFYRAALGEWELASYSKKPGYIYKSSHLYNAMTYIRSNREKHGMLKSDELEKIICDFVVDEDVAYGINP